MSTAPNTKQKIRIQEEIMHRIYADVQREVEGWLIFGPCNTRAAEAQRLGSMRYKLFYPELKHRSIANCSSSLLFDRIMNETYPKEPTPNKLCNIALRGIWSGTGTCETYAILGAIFLAQKFQVAVSIENIHSDLTHTYLKLHTEPQEYIFDFWSNGMIRYGDWVDWNESVDYEYRHQEATTFSYLAEQVPYEELNNILSIITKKEHIATRQAHLKQVDLTMHPPSPTSINHIDP